ncbi:nucleic acid binding protein (plasmid) [Mycobacterium liflandii 128FXT]|uniref:Nucleic acid binding protein n=1 Tax=Mycobacterium liflandii (strain 128FXT) TaxID=459424 RepID=B6CLU9_MYCL1|nr:MULTISPECIES: nucleic acid-binding protein [Mycobacterium ulcerans group]ACA57586.1 nucleic acid binding protein [Mycobacterium liflandii 128FXT]
MTPTAALFSQAKMPQGDSAVRQLAHSAMISPNPIPAALSARVPELAQQLVDIVAIARIPGVRAKVAVRSRVAGINPVSVCIGWGGLRIADVEKGLGGERIHVVAYHVDPATYVINALGCPGTGTGTGAAAAAEERSRRIRVRVEAHDYPRTVGKAGQNVRLASKLTGQKIEILVEKSCTADCFA